jgi:hypothetical protein
MQNDLFSDLTQILPHLAGLESKIEKLRTLGKWVNESQVEIFISLPDGKVEELEQFLIPFNLQGEMRTLIDDSIDELQRQHDHLLKLFNETNH